MKKIKHHRAWVCKLQCKSNIFRILPEYYQLNIIEPRGKIEYIKSIIELILRIIKEFKSIHKEYEVQVYGKAYYLMDT